MFWQEILWSWKWDFYVFPVLYFTRATNLRDRGGKFHAWLLPELSHTSRFITWAPGNESPESQGNAAEMGSIPRALGWVQGPLPKAAPILWKPRTRVMPTSGSAPSGMPLPREMLASSPHPWGLNYLINPFPSACESLFPLILSPCSHSHPTPSVPPTHLSSLKPSGLLSPALSGSVCHLGDCRPLSL